MTLPSVLLIKVVTKVIVEVLITDLCVGMDKEVSLSKSLLGNSMR